MKPSKCSRLVNRLKMDTNSVTIFNLFTSLLHLLGFMNNNE